MNNGVFDIVMKETTKKAIKSPYKEIEQKMKVK
jgi:hypothetical protein